MDLIYSSPRTKRVFENETYIPTFNWKIIGDIDPDVLETSKDTKSMNLILNEFLNNTFSHADYIIIQNPVVIRLIKQLQCIMRYLVSTQNEVMSLYKESENENGKLRSMIHKMKNKLSTYKNQIECLEKQEKCPICHKCYSSDYELDKHIKRSHRPMFSTWRGFRTGVVSNNLEEKKELQKQIHELREAINIQRNEQKRLEKTIDEKTLKESHQDLKPMKAHPFRISNVVTESIKESIPSFNEKPSIPSKNVAIFQMSPQLNSNFIDTETIKRSAREFLDKKGSGSTNQEEIEQYGNKIRQTIHEQGLIKKESKKKIPKIASVDRGSTEKTAKRNNLLDVKQPTKSKRAHDRIVAGSNVSSEIIEIGAKNGQANTLDNFVSGDAFEIDDENLNSVEDITKFMPVSAPDNTVVNTKTIPLNAIDNISSNASIPNDLIMPIDMVESDNIISSSKKVNKIGSTNSNENSIEDIPIDITKIDKPNHKETNGGQPSPIDTAVNDVHQNNEHSEVTSPTKDCNLENHDIDDIEYEDLSVPEKTSIHTEPKIDDEYIDLGNIASNKKPKADDIEYIDLNDHAHDNPETDDEYIDLNNNPPEPKTNVALKSKPDHVNHDIDNLSDFDVNQSDPPRKKSSKVMKKNDIIDELSDIDTPDQNIAAQPNIAKEDSDGDDSLFQFLDQNEKEKPRVLENENELIEQLLESLE